MIKTDNPQPFFPVCIMKKEPQTEFRVSSMSTAGASFLNSSTVSFQIFACASFPARDRTNDDGLLAVSVASEANLRDGLATYSFTCCSLR